jgi:hypothetical protein
VNRRKTQSPKDESVKLTTISPSLPPWAVTQKITTAKNKVESHKGGKYYLYLIIIVNF